MTTCLGCGRLVSPGPRCPDCLSRQRRTYDQTRPAHHAIYRTAGWRRLSAAVRAAATRCHWCGKWTQRLVADHIVPVGQRPDLALEPSNVVASCVGCNVRRGYNLRHPTHHQLTVDELVARQRREQRDVDAVMLTPRVGGGAGSARAATLAPRPPIRAVAKCTLQKSRAKTAGIDAR
jgi:hypothetical protein